MMQMTVHSIGTCLAMWTPGLPEIILVLAVLLLLFGGKKLPELAKGLGRSLKVFKKELTDVSDTLKDDGPTDDSTDASADRIPDRALFISPSGDVTPARASATCAWAAVTAASSAATPSLACSSCTCAVSTAN